ncbi:hypothetical protein D3C81_1324990 [compost metagenome]
METRERFGSRPFDHFAFVIESGSVARAVPRTFRLVPFDLAAHMGAGRIKQIEQPVLVTVRPGSFALVLHDAALTWNEVLRFQVDDFDFAGYEFFGYICVLRHEMLDRGVRFKPGWGKQLGITVLLLQNEVSDHHRGQRAGAHSPFIEARGNVNIRMSRCNPSDIRYSIQRD